MPDSSITKRALANAMKELMREKPLVKISISDIVARCHMNRQSFYYHFRDKFDLVNWIFYTELIGALQSAEIKTTWDGALSICQYLYENKEFYISALKFTGQNSFYEYFGDVMYQLFKELFGGMFADSSQSEFNAVFYADAFRSSICRWLMSGAHENHEEYFKKLRNAFVETDMASDGHKLTADKIVEQIPWA